MWCIYFQVWQFFLIIVLHAWICFDEDSGFLYDFWYALFHIHLTLADVSFSMAYTPLQWLVIISLDSTEKDSSSFLLFGGGISVVVHTYKGSGCTLCQDMILPKKGTLMHLKWQFNFLIWHFPFSIFALLISVLYHNFCHWCHSPQLKYDLQYQKQIFEDLIYVVLKHVTCWSCSIW